MSGPDHSSECQASPPVPTDDRLDSWKEIALFLQRDVRTVQRWEKHAGLPVYRHAESRLRTAYAYRSAAEALAAIADSRGDVGRSIGLLTDAAAERAHTYSFPQWTAAYWIRMSADLAQRCRRAGRNDEAERINVGLRQILDIGEPQGPPGPTAPARR